MRGTHEGAKRNVSADRQKKAEGELYNYVCNSYFSYNIRDIFVFPALSCLMRSA